MMNVENNEQYFPKSDLKNCLDLVYTFEIVERLLIRSCFGLENSLRINPAYCAGSIHTRSENSTTVLNSYNDLSDVGYYLHGK